MGQEQLKSIFNDLNNKDRDEIIKSLDDDPHIPTKLNLPNDTNSTTDFSKSGLLYYWSLKRKGKNYPQKTSVDSFEEKYQKKLLEAVSTHILKNQSRQTLPNTSSSKNIQEILKEQITIPTPSISGSSNLQPNALGIDESLRLNDSSKTQVDYEIVGHFHNGLFDLSLKISNGGIHNYDADSIGSNSKDLIPLIPKDKNNKLITPIFQMDSSNYFELMNEMNEYRVSAKSRVSQLQENIKLKKDEQLIYNELKKIRAQFPKAYYVDMLARNIIDTLHQNDKCRPKKPDADYIVLDEEKEFFENLSNSIRMQKEMKQGIALVKGPSGLGKTSAINYFGAVLNMPVYNLTCTGTMTQNDIISAPTMKNGRTYFNSSEFIERCQQPGIINFDEIDLLENAVRTRLYGCCNTKREIVHPQWPEPIKIHPQCFFTCTLNGYSSSPIPLLNRALVVNLKSSNTLNSKIKICKWSGLFDGRNIDQIKNYITSKGREHNTGQTELMKNIEKMSTLRQLCQENGTEDTFEKLDYEFGPRDILQCFYSYTKLGGKKTLQSIVKETIITKAELAAGDSFSKKIQKTIAENLINKAFG